MREAIKVNLESGDLSLETEIPGQASPMGPEPQVPKPEVP